MSVAAAIHQLPADTTVPNAVIRRWLDATPDELTARVGLSWALGKDELGAARYAVLRRRGSEAPAVVLVAYDGSDGIDLLASEALSESDIDALLNELHVGSGLPASTAPADRRDDTRALEQRIERLERKVLPSKRRKVRGRRRSDDS